MRPMIQLSQACRKSAFALATLAMLVGGPVSAADRVPNDTYYDELWYLRHLGVPEAWNRSLGLETVPVAVIDTGVDIDHPDLKDNIWRNVDEVAGNGVDDDGNGYVDDIHGWDFVNGDADPRPVTTGDYTVVGANHGTVGAGMIAARGDNARGIVGVTWQAAIMPIRALDSRGNGDPTSVEFAVRYAVENGAKVINLSFAGTAYSPGLRDALRAAYDAGVFVVAAAGNAPDGGAPVDLDTQPLYPICLDRDSSENFIYGVASTDESDARAKFSNYGVGCVDGSAPGVRVLGAQVYRPAEKFFVEPYGGFYEGTSVSAPMVSGVVALLRALDPNLTPKQITNILTATAAPVVGLDDTMYGKFGRGRIDADKAVAAVAERTRPTGPALPAPTVIPAGSGGLVVTAPAGLRSPELRLFTLDGLFLRSFMAFPDGFTGGVSLAAGDFDGTKRSSIVAGALAGGAPQVRIFDLNTLPIGGFLAYDERFRGGVQVATGDLDGDGIDEIVTGAGSGGGPHVRIFDARGHVKGGFFAFDPALRKGVTVALTDIDGDGRAEILASAPGVTAARVYDLRGQRLTALEGRPTPSAGLRVIGAAKGTEPVVTLWRPPAYAPFAFYAYEPKFRGGVNAISTE